jgi:tetratricopeptide (TPR) repeat protein
MRRIAVLLLLLLPMACLREAKKAAKPKPMTDAQASTFIAGYIDALEKGKVDDAGSYIDWDTLIENATSGAGLQNEMFRQSLLIGAKKQAKGPSFARQLSDLVKNGGSLHLLRAYTSTDGTNHVLIRLLLPDGAVNYHEMIVTNDDKGVPRVRDIYVFTSAELLSDTMHRMFLFALAQDPNALEKLSGQKNPMFEHLEEYKGMMEKVRSGDAAGAEALYRRLPIEIQRQKNVMLAHVFASSKLGNDEKYLKAMDEMRRLFPQDGAIDLMSIDAYLLRGKWDDALGAINRLDESVGDPYLDVFRANINLRRGDVEKARRFAVQAAEREPLLEPAWWAQVNISLADRNHAETVRLLTHLRDVLQVKLADLTTLPDYAAFVDSPEYAAWAK